MTSFGRLLLGRVAFPGGFPRSALSLRLACAPSARCCSSSPTASTQQVESQRPRAALRDRQAQRTRSSTLMKQLAAVPAKDRLQLMVAHVETERTIRSNSQPTTRVLADDVTDDELCARVAIDSRDNSHDASKDKMNLVGLLALQARRGAYPAARRTLHWWLAQVKETATCEKDELKKAGWMLSRIYAAGVDLPGDRVIRDRIRDLVSSSTTLSHPDRVHLEYLLLACDAKEHSDRERLSRLLVEHPPTRRDEAIAAASAAARLGDLALFARAIETTSAQSMISLFASSDLFTAFVDRLLPQVPGDAGAWLIEYMKREGETVKARDLVRFVAVMGQCGYESETVDVVDGACSKCARILPTTRELDDDEFRQLREALGRYFLEQLKRFCPFSEPGFARDFESLKRITTTARSPRDHNSPRLPSLIVDAISLQFEARRRTLRPLTFLSNLLVAQRDRFDAVCMICSENLPAKNAAVQRRLREMDVREWRGEHRRRGLMDLFVLLAAMRMGADAFVLSSGHFHDHAKNLDRNGVAFFRRWTATRCITLEWDENDAKRAQLKVRVGG